MADSHKNFAYSLVATAPSPATSGTSLVVTAGQGTLFPAVPFNATVWPAGSNPLSTNAEIVRVTAITTDTLTITRAQESSSARSIIVGDQIAATITAKTLTDVEFSDSAGLRALLSDETGSGLAVFATSPTLTTPVIASIVNTGTQTVPTVTGTLTQYIETTVASSATPTPTGDARVNWYQLTALGAAAVFAVPSGTPANHNELYIRILDNATARGLTWNAIYRASSDLPLPSTTVLSKTMYLKFIYNSASSTWDLVSLLNNF